MENEEIVSNKVLLLLSEHRKKMYENIDETAEKIKSLLIKNKAMNPNDNRSAYRILASFYKHVSINQRSRSK